VACEWEDTAASAALKRIAYAARIPISVMFEVTLRCNIRCVHCYNFDRNAPRPVSEELAPEEVFDLLRQVREEGCLFVAFTGGEALVHPRIWDYIAEAGRRSMAVRILTNGTPLTDRVVDRLAAFEHLQGLDVSVYGATPETHDAITCVPGSFARTWAGIRRLRARGIRAKVKFVLMRSNAHEAAAMIAQAEAEGVPFLVDAHITARYDGTDSSLSQRPVRAQLEALYRGPLRRFLEEAGLGRGPQPLRCNCAIDRAAIMANGDVYPCVAAPLAGGNVRRQTFREIWRHSPVFERIRALREEDFRACHPCPLRPWCQREAGQSYLASGEYTGVDPWFCEEAEVVRAVLTTPPAGDR
jgi:radical SAM protein with 4Fe4S-binding SPASM domain